MKEGDEILGELSAHIMRVRRENPELKSGLKVILINAIKEIGA